MKDLHVAITVALVLAIAGATFAGTQRYSDGVLLISFVEEMELELDENGIVKADDPEIDRLFQRFGAYEIRDFFGGYIPRDEQYRYLTRNDYILMFPSGTDMELVAEELSRLKGINWAEVDLHHPVCFVPNDPAYNSQWWLHAIDSERAWDVVTGDESVIVTGLDMGIDWNHPDLADNIWVNPGEDLDDDHRPFGEMFPDQPGTFGDWNSTDDDGNGLVDDVIGYDWVDNQNDAEEGEDGRDRDNNPMDFDGHGTGVNGAMAAVANNGIGGASIAFGCKIMSLRCGYKPEGRIGAILPSAYIPAMAYAVDEGANVINMSFGVYQFQSSTNNAIQNAWNNGLLIFAAAGNDGTSQLSYPANYNNVISVAAVNQNGSRANFSNYGDWVDISAPGVSCYTPWFNDRYSSWDGTSVSSPIAAGVGALVVSMMPNSWNFEWSNYIISTTDPLTPDRPIGSGRVNAYKAVTQYYWPELTIDEWSMSDPDGNGHPDIGEEIEVRLSVSNEEGWQDAMLTTAAISFSRPGVRLDASSVLFGNIAGGENVNNNDNPMRFTVPEGGPDGHFSYFYLTVTALPNDFEIGVRQKVMLGTPEIILVDDDGGSDLESYIRSDLDRYFYNYLHYDINALAGTLTADYLSGFEAILWTTGNQPNPLSEDERTALQGAMDNGSNLFLFGQTLNEQLTGTEFYSDYLFVQDGIGNGEIGLVAVDDAGEPIIPESRLVLAGPGGAGNSTSPDVIEVTGNAHAAYQYLTNQGTAGIYYSDDTRKHVYFTFALEAVSGQSGTIERHEIVHSILSWFDIASTPELEDEQTLPSGFSIEAAYPNPFNPSTTLRIAIPQRSKVKLRIIDLLGREVAVLADRELNTGFHTFNWNATQQATGIYFAALEAEGGRYIRKLVYVK